MWHTLEKWINHMWITWWIQVAHTWVSNTQINRIFFTPMVPFLSPLTHPLSPLLWFLTPQVYCSCVEPFISGHVTCTFYVQLFSFNTVFEKFIHTVACCCSIYSTMCFYAINLFILKLINILVVFSLWLLWIVLLWMSQFLIK